MRQIAISEFRKLSAAEIEIMLPLTLLADGKPIAYITRQEDVVVISDLHIRVQNKFRALEKKVRIGMPKPEKIVKTKVE